MKIGVIGDSHQGFQNIKSSLKHFDGVEFIIHTGDNYEDKEFIQRNYNVKVIAVKGNCDYIGDEEVVIKINGYNFFICHGHNYNVKHHLTDLIKKAKAQRADVAIFGHTHIPYNRMEGSLLLLNPGSLSYPRGGSSKSCCLLELGDSIKIKHIALE